MYVRPRINKENYFKEMSAKILENDPKIIKRLQISHRKAIKNAKSRIDLKPTKLLANTFLNVNKLKDDFLANRKILHDNIQLLRRINYIQRNHGKTINYNEHKGHKSAYVERMNKQLQRIQKENFEFGSRLQKIKSSLDTRRSVKSLKGPTKSEDPKYQINEAIVEAYVSATSVAESHLMRELLRPKIYLDLYIKNLRPLGRLTIQLYTEACPELVLEFVRMCTYHSLDLIKFIRIFPQLWIEGELLVQSDELSHSGYEYRTDCLGHMNSSGILSFAQCYLQGFPPELLNFCITFKPLPIPGDERIAFGVVCKGSNILKCLSDYGTKNGKMKNEINVVKCGVL